MTTTLFSNGCIPLGIYKRSRQAVLLPTYKKSEMLCMLLIATDRKPTNWKVGVNENGWWFVFRPSKSDGVITVNVNA